VFPLIDATAAFDEAYVNAPVLFDVGAVNVKAASPTVFEIDAKPEMVGFDNTVVVVTGAAITVIVLTILPPL
jgi:hypothetical protein